MSFATLARLDPSPLAPAWLSAAEPTALPIAEWLLPILDHIDYGILVVDEQAHVLFANSAAREALRHAHPLRIEAHRLRATLDSDAARLHGALGAAAGRALRTLLTLGDGDGAACAAVVPIPPAGAGSRRSALVVIGKQTVCGELSAQWYARLHGLTLAESQVLRLLCGGAMPNEIARSQGVAVSTIRTQIGSIRAKTGARNIGALVRQVSLLPPLMNALQPAATTQLAA